jgi:sporulation protein YlmC with PRC-barrel domain
MLPCSTNRKSLIQKTGGAGLEVPGGCGFCTLGAERGGDIGQERWELSCTFAIIKQDHGRNIMRRGQVIWSAVLTLALGICTGVAQQARDRLAQPPIYGETAGQLMPANRASEILGMRVENQMNERLGTIRDVVLDFRTGRIAYVVLSTPDARGERLIAVPPAALQATRDPERLFLSIDRERLARIPGFDRRNWPDIEQPFWGAEGMWGRPVDDMLSPAPRGWDQDRIIVDRFQQPDRRQVDRDTLDRFDRTERFDRTDRFERTDRWREADEGSFRGTVVAINPETRTMSVESPTGELRHFEIGERPNIQMFSLRNPRLVDIRVGYPVNVGYRMARDGTAVVHTVLRTDRPEVR